MRLAGRNGRAVATLALRLSVALALFTVACGYRVGSTGPGLPPNIRSIGIVPFENTTLTYRIEQTLTSAVRHEFLTRTSYRVESDTNTDATLSGVVTAVYSSPIVFDPSSGRTTEVLLTVGLRVRLVNNATGEVLFEANDWTYREPYEVSRDPSTYFGENLPALERLSRQVAGSLVSAVLGKIS